MVNPYQFRTDRIWRVILHILIFVSSVKGFAMYFSKRVLTTAGFVPLSKEKALYDKALILYNHFEKHSLWYTGDPNVAHLTVDESYVYGVAKNYVQITERKAAHKFTVYQHEGKTMVRFGFEFKPLKFHPFLQDSDGNLLNYLTVKPLTQNMQEHPWLFDHCIRVTAKHKYIDMTDNVYPPTVKKSPSMCCCEVIEHFEKSYPVKLELSASSEQKVSELRIVSFL